MRNFPELTTRADLEKLIGQSETARLEFKQSKIFSKSREALAEDLSCHVSAFANTEGGTIVIGMEESKGKGFRRAIRIDDGVPASEWSPERLENFILGNVRPPFPEIRVVPIPLDDRHDRLAFVINIPQGTTAYQASDRRYYGRSQYRVDPLYHNDIYLRMFREKRPRATLLLENLQWGPAQLPLPQARHTFENNPNFPDFQIPVGADTGIAVHSYWFNILLHNTGELNITEFKVDIAFFGLGEGQLDPISYAVKDGWEDEVTSLPLRSPTSARKQMHVNIYPDDTRQISRRTFYLPKETPIAQHLVTLAWKLYLPNTPPQTGELNLSELFEGIKPDDKISPLWQY